MTQPSKLSTKTLLSILKAFTNDHMPTTSFIWCSQLKPKDSPSSISNKTQELALKFHSTTFLIRYPQDNSKSKTSSSKKQKPPTISLKFRRVTSKLRLQSVGSTEIQRLNQVVSWHCMERRKAKGKWLLSKRSSLYHVQLLLTSVLPIKNLAKTIKNWLSSLLQTAISWWLWTPDWSSQTFNWLSLRRRFTSILRKVRNLISRSRETKMPARTKRTTS